MHQLIPCCGEQWSTNIQKNEKNHKKYKLEGKKERKLAVKIHKRKPMTLGKNLLRKFSILIRSAKGKKKCWSY